MPIFNYECKNCNNEFEELVFNNEEVNCPNCNSKNVKRIMSLSNFHLKGDGWYKDGYSKPPPKKDVKKTKKE